MDKVRWGIMSTAEIGAAKVIPAMQKSVYCDIQALASRSLEKAKTLAARLKILEAGHLFDFGRLCAYKLKLLLREKIEELLKALSDEEALEEVPLIARDIINRLKFHE